MGSDVAFEQAAIVGGRYRIAHLLGRGAMGAVYAAEHLALGEQVAIKVLHPEAASEPTAITRFVNEARATFRIQGEHVVRVIDVGEHEGRPYMVMEYLAGEDLAQLLARTGRLPMDVGLDYVQQAIAGVAQAHAVGIVHRDLKPANLFLAHRADGTTIVKVLDFGISKVEHAAIGDSAKLTNTRTVLGSPAYMSPEQLRDAHTADARSDVWALGIILHELLTGQLPFEGEALGALFAAILEQEPTPLREHLPEAPAWLNEVLRRCLRRRPEERFQTVDELARALREQGASTWTTDVLGFPVPGPLPQANDPSKPPAEDASSEPRTQHASDWASSSPRASSDLRASPADTVDPIHDTGVNVAALRRSRLSVAFTAGLVAVVLMLGIWGSRSMGSSPRGAASISSGGGPATSGAVFEVPATSASSATSAALGTQELASGSEPTVLAVQPRPPAAVTPPAAAASPSATASTSLGDRTKAPTAAPSSKRPAIAVPSNKSPRPLPRAPEYNPWQASRKGT